MSHVPPPNPFGNNYQQPAEATNPYAVPVTQPAGNLGGSDPESIRKYYISHEASVKSIGTLYMLGAFFGGLATIIYVLAFIGAMTSNDPQQQAIMPLMFVLTLVMGAISVTQAFTSVGLWRLRPWARITATVLAAIGLLFFPLGTIINGYFIWLLQSQKGGVVFSPAYQAIIQQTPHVKYRTSIIVWIILGLLVLFVVFIIAMGVMSGMR